MLDIGIGEQGILESYSFPLLIYFSSRLCWRAMNKVTSTDRFKTSDETIYDHVQRGDVWI